MSKIRVERKPVKKTIYAMNVEVRLGKRVLVENASFEYFYAKIENFLDGKNFSFRVPDPASLFLVYSIFRINSLKDLKEEFKKSREVGNEDILSEKQEEIFDDILLNTVSIPIMLYSALESFANQQVFKESFRFDYGKWKHKKGLFYDSYGIQRHLSLEEKLLKVLPQINNVKLEKVFAGKAQKSISNLVTIRDGVVHQKMTSKQNEDFVNLLKTLLEINWPEFFLEIQEIMQKLKGHECTPTDHLWVKK